MITAVRVPDQVMHWLAVAVIVAALPHVDRLPVWVAVLIPAAILLRIGLGRPPSRWLLVPLVVAVFVGVVVQFRAISGLEAGGAFFTAMVALKFLESRSTRDAGLLACLAYFQAVATFLYSETIAMAVYVAGSLLLTTVALMTLTAPQPAPPVRRRLVESGSLLLQAVPIMLVLFVLFPRIPGPLWSLHDHSQAQTGLSDSMTPGEVAELAVSHEVAFRVEFDGDAPAPEYHYWRGPVFTHYDGASWSEGESATDDPPELAAGDRAVDYILTLVPHQRRWLFALDMPADDVPRGAGLNGARQLLTEDRVRSTRRFELTSLIAYRLEPELSAGRRERALSLPADAAPRARELADDLRAAADDDPALVAAALTWFREGGFEYTLRPPALGDDPVDDFLFDTRSGFCEYFAGAFAVLMRAAGIPARIVTGYLGSEQASVGDYYIVRQSDAHAWVEVWLPDRGWTRVDPTATVSPDRIQLGLSGIPGTEDMLPGFRRDDDSIRHRLALAWDGINYSWNRFVLGYGPELQERLLERIGLDALGRYALGVLSVVVAGLLVVAVWLLGRSGDRPRDGVERAWRRVERRLSRLGWRRDPHEGVYAYARRVAGQRPDLATPLLRLAELHDRVRYRPHADAATRRRFVQAARAFRPRRRRHTTPTSSWGRSGGR